jgi:hypothetical protein
VGLGMSAPLTVILTRAWTRAYTLGLPTHLREARRAEIESDLWESLHDPDLPPPQILPRLAGGVVDDVCWRATLTAEESRTVWLTIASGCLMLAAMWEWLARPALMERLQESVWVYPLVESVHVLGITVFLGLNVMLDLRILGLTLRRVAVSEVASYVLPWVSPSALVTLATGMLLFLEDAARFAANPFFDLKVAALVFAVINLLIFQLTVYSRIDDWDAQPTPPLAARVSAGLSLALWAIVLAASRLVAYNWFG